MRDPELFYDGEGGVGYDGPEIEEEEIPEDGPTSPVPAFHVQSLQTQKGRVANRNGPFAVSW